MPTKLTTKHGWLIRYAAAVAAVGAGFLLRLGLTALVGEGLPTYITFYPAIMAVALLGGVGPGLLATFAAALVVDYWILPPTHGFGVANLVDAVGLAFFSGMGIFMSAVAELYRRARQKAAAYDTGLLRREGQEMSRQPLGETVMLFGGLVLALAILAAAGWQTYQNLAKTAQADRWIGHTYIVDEELEHLFSTLKDMDSSERGYLIMGEEDYLRPYHMAERTVASQLASLKRLTEDNPHQAQRLKGIEALVEAKLADMKEVIEARRSQGLEAAHALMASGKGQTLTEEIRKRMTEAQEDEGRLLQKRTAARDASLHKTLLALLAGGVLSFLLLTTVFVFLKQENLRRRRAEQTLRRHQQDLEELIATRTADLGRANESLRQQREWLQVTLSSIGDAVLASDTAGHITFLNPVAETLTGWAEKEALGQLVHDVFRVINEETRTPGEDIFARVLREGRAVALANHTALVTRDGREVPIEDSAAPIKDSTGTISGVVLVFHDVTQKRWAQAELRQSEERLTFALETSHTGAWELDLRDHTAHRSLEHDRIFGYPALLPQWTYEMFLEHVLPEDRPSADTKFRRAVETGGDWNFECRIRRADQQVRWIWAVGRHRADTAGLPQKMMGIVQDITERKRAEQVLEESERQFHTLADSIPNLAWWASADGYITWYNQRWYEYTGTTPQQMEGWGWQSVHDPRTLPAVLERWKASLATGQPFNMTFPLRGADGVFRPFLTLVMPLKDAEGRVQQWFGTNTDISEQKRAEETEQRLNAELRQRVADLQAANEEVRASRQAALSLAEDAFEARKEAERINAELQTANESLGVSRRAALNLMDDAVRAQKQAEQVSADLRQSEERYRGLVELSPEAVFVNRNDRIVLVNPAALQLFGASSVEQLMGKSPFQLFHPDYHAVMHERIRRVFAGLRVPILEEKILRLDGVAVDVEVLASPVTDQGERAVQLLLRDITERKRAAQRTALLAETASRLLAAESPQTVVEDLCRNVLAFLDCQVFFNFLVDEVARGLRLNACAGIPPEEVSKLEWLNFGQAVCGCAARDGSCIVAEDIQHTLDPRTELVKALGVQAYACHPLIAQGRVLGTLSFGTRNRLRFRQEELALMNAVADQVAVALERQRAQAALQQTAEDLQRSNRDLEQFAYVASHDLQEPLRAVGGYVKLLQLRFREKLDAKAHEYITGAFDGALRMERLIIDLLAYSRIGTRGGDFALAELNTLLAQALSNLEAGIKSARAEVTHDALPALSVDATQMMQLFQNLIGNALKFRGEQPPKIHVGAQRQDGRWVFSVRDNGIGIEPQYSERIFQVFQRLHTRKEYPGTGIGLAICKKIVERHGGTIWVESQPGEGSTFYFSIPEAAGR